MKTKTLTTLIILLFCALSCSYDSEDDLIQDSNNGGNDPSPNVVNYVDDIKPIMQSSCIACHGNPPTNGAPFALINFSQVSQRAEAVFNSMNLQNGAPGSMPPLGRLPQSTIDLIDEWIQNGKPEN